MMHTRIAPAFFAAALMLVGTAGVKAADIVETAVGAGTFRFFRDFSGCVAEA